MEELASGQTVGREGNIAEARARNMWSYFADYFFFAIGPARTENFRLDCKADVLNKKIENQ